MKPLAKRRPSVTPHSAFRTPPSQGLSRRKFILAGGAVAAGFTIVPRHVLGGPGFVPPSEKITLAYIGCGTQGLREMPARCSRCRRCKSWRSATRSRKATPTWTGPKMGCARNLPARWTIRRGQREALARWVEAVRGGKPTYGDFLLAGPISDAFNLAAVSLRLGGKRLLFDSANAKITNVPEANNYLMREYRKGWELAGA